MLPCCPVTGLTEGCLNYLKVLTGHRYYTPSAFQHDWSSSHTLGSAPIDVLGGGLVPPPNRSKVGGILNFGLGASLLNLGPHGSL